MRTPLLAALLALTAVASSASGCNGSPSHPRPGGGGSSSSPPGGSPDASDGSSPFPTWACLAPYATPEARDPGLWPFASDSPWNTPLGAAQFEQTTDPCTEDLLTRPAGGATWIDSHNWSHPIYLATATDPTVNLYYKGTLVDANVHCPTGAQPALPSPPNTDAHLHIIDPTHRSLDEMWEASATSDGWDSRAWVKTDLLGPGVGQSGVRAYGGSAIGGLIRVGELTGGIRHALAFAIEQSQQKDSWVWPATANDQSPAANYTGHIPMGQLIGIPPGVDLCTLNLSPAGLVLARALQDYGGYLADTAGSFAFYAEPRVEDDTSGGEVTRLNDARTDLAKITPALRCVTNNTASTVGGGGARRAPTAPAVP